MDNWISVDNLPESDTEVLCTNEYDQWIDICILKRKNWYVANLYEPFKSSNQNLNVQVFPTHWQPLPSPPNTGNK